MLEQITGFCARAVDPTWALDVGIYEYELPEIRAALDAARARGAQVRIVFHAKPGDPQTTINADNLTAWPATDKRARVTSKIFHDKFIVASRMHGDDRVPQAVLCGSTNFTENGVYRQANVVHVAERPDLAAQYLVLFEVLFGGDDPDRDAPLDRRARPAVGRRADRRRLLAAQRAGRSRPVRGGDRRRGARRAVLHRVRAAREDPQRAARRAARHDPAPRPAELAQHDHRDPPRPHGGVRRDRDAQQRAGGIPQGVHRRPEGQHPHPHEADRRGLHRPTRRRSSAARTTCRPARRTATTRTT